MAKTERPNGYVFVYHRGIVFTWNTPVVTADAVAGQPFCCTRSFVGGRDSCVSVQRAPRRRRRWCVYARCYPCTVNRHTGAPSRLYVNDDIVFASHRQLSIEPFGRITLTRDRGKMPNLRRDAKSNENAAPSTGLSLQGSHVRTNRLCGVYTNRFRSLFWTKQTCEPFSFSFVLHKCLSFFFFFFNFHHIFVTGRRLETDS